MEFICIKCQQGFEHCGCDSTLKSPCSCNNPIVLSADKFKKLTGQDLVLLYQDCTPCDMYIQKGMRNNIPLLVCKLTNKIKNTICPLNLL